MQVVADAVENAVQRAHLRLASDSRWRAEDECSLRNRSAERGGEVVCEPGRRMHKEDDANPVNSMSKICNFVFAGRRLKANGRTSRNPDCRCRDCTLPAAAKLARPWEHQYVVACGRGQCRIQQQREALLQSQGVKK
jgi:hypothetical protein